VNVATTSVAIDQQAALPFRDAQLIEPDPGKGFERRAGGTTAVRTVAVECVDKLILDDVLNGTAQTLAPESRERLMSGSRAHATITQRPCCAAAVL
jgi:hypothetical protein